MSDGPELSQDAGGTGSGRRGPPAVAPSEPDPQRLMLAIGVLLVFAAMFGIAQVAVAHDDVLVPSRVARWKGETDMYVDQRFFHGEADRLMFGVVPSADYADGGAYFFGASLTGRALTIWDWPAAVRSRAHDYCVPAATDLEQCQLVQYLIDHEGFLPSGGRRTVVILELFFGSASRSDTPEFKEIDQGWQSWFNHPGLLRYDVRQGVRPDAGARWARWLRIARVRSEAFWDWADRAAVGVSTRPPFIVPGSPMAPPLARDYWARRMGPGWEAAMDAELADVGRTVDLLRARGAAVAAVYMPQAPWADHFDRAVRYRERVLGLMASRSVEVLDLGQSLGPADFVDTVHLTRAGGAKIQPRLSALAERYLDRPEAATRPTSPPAAGEMAR